MTLQQLKDRHLLESHMLELCGWYRSHCDGSWEHGFGIQIETVDNPGWSVKIDLEGTRYRERSFESISLETSAEDWIDCKVADGQFVAACGPDLLPVVIGTFLEWCRTASEWVVEEE